MFNVKIGFVPSNWESWDGNQFTGKWAGKMRDRCIAVLEKIPGISIVVPSRELTADGCVSTVEDGIKTLELFRKEDIQGLIIGNMTFGFEIALSPILSGLPKDMPILHFATRSGPISEAGNRSTDTWCGHFMTSSSIKRHGFKSVHIRTCNPEDPVFAEQAELFVRACNAVARFKGARIVQIGTRPTNFESQFFSEENMMRQFGQTLIPVDLATAFTYIDAIPHEDPKVIALAKEIRGSVDAISNELPDSLVNQARYELSLKNIVREHHADALAAACWSQLQERYNIAACSTFGRLTGQGIMAACEVDVMGGVTMLVLHALGLGQTPPDFIDWTDLHPTEPNTWLAWHCGNAAGQLCCESCQKLLTSNERLALWSDNCHGTLEFKMRSGPVTCARIVEYEGKYSCFFGKGEIVDIGPKSRGSYGWVRVKDIGDWEDKMIETGVIHHGVLIHDPKTADAMEMFCKFTGIQAVRGA
jgi:L-fucose isomerase-like protein